MSPNDWMLAIALLLGFTFLVNTALYVFGYFEPREMELGKEQHHA